MPRLFGRDIAKLTTRTLGKKLLPATLIKVAAGARSSSNLAGGVNATTTEHAARGVVTAGSEQDEPGSLVSQRSATVMLLAASIAGGARPDPGDRVKIDGATYSILRVDTDPAGATHTMQVR